MTLRRHLAILALLATLPLIPYCLLGYNGHDFRFQVASWMEIHDALTSSHAPISHPLSTHWSTLSNYTLGDAHLLYYPPVSLFLGAALAFLVPLQLVPAAFAFLALLLAALAMYFTASRLLAPSHRLPAAILYLISPYLITSSLIRFSAGELLTQSWLPLILLAVHHVLLRPTRRALLLLAAFLALTWLTNIPAALVLLYTLVPAAAVFALFRLTLQPLLRILLAQLLAGLLAAFYLIPLWLEQPWFSKRDLVRTGPHQLLLFMPRTLRGVPNLFHLCCWFFTLALAAIALLCLRPELASRFKLLRGDPSLQLWTLLFLVGLVFQLPLSLPLWDHLPQLTFVAFPYRFLAVMGSTLPLILLAPNTPHTLRRPIFLALALLALIPFALFIRTQLRPSSATRSFPVQLTDWRAHGIPGAPEWLPVAPNGVPASAGLDPQPESEPAPFLSATCPFTPFSPGVLTTNSPTPCLLIAPILFHPYWRALAADHTPLRTSAAPDGRLQITLPPGPQTLHLDFHPASPARTGSALLSVATLLTLLLLFILSPPANPHTL